MTAVYFQSARVLPYVLVTPFASMAFMRRHPTARLPSKGLIGYHFAGKDELIRQAVAEIIAERKAYMTPASSPSRPDSGCCGRTSNRTSVLCESPQLHGRDRGDQAEWSLGRWQETFYADANVNEFAGELESLLSKSDGTVGLRPFEMTDVGDVTAACQAGRFLAGSTRVIGRVQAGIIARPGRTIQRRQRRWLAETTWRTPDFPSFLRRSRSRSSRGDLSDSSPRAFLR